MYIRSNIIIVTVATTLILSSNLALAADPIMMQESALKQEKIYGKQLITEQERIEQRSKMRAAKTPEEKEQIRTKNQERMKQRAKEQGVTLINKKQNKQMGKRFGSLNTNPNKFDSRQTLSLNQAQQSHVLSEMRSLLAGTQAIVAALATDDMDIVAKQARRLGMGMKKKPENKLHGILPKAFMMQGKAVHMAFDAIADDAESIKDPKHTLKQLGEALSLCKGCHEMYRIEVNNSSAGMGKRRISTKQGFGEMKHKENN